MKMAFLLISILINTLSANAQLTFDKYNTVVASELRFDRSIKIGDTITSIQNLVLQKKSDENEIKWYSRIGDKKLLEDIKFKKIRYGFRNGILTEVYGTFDDSQLPLLKLLFQNSFSRFDYLKGYLTLYPQLTVTNGDYFPNYIKYYYHYNSKGIYTYLRGNEFYIEYVSY